MLILSGVAAIAVIAGFVWIMVRYHRKPHRFGCFVTVFNTDTFSRHYYLLFSGKIIVLTTLLVGMNSIQYVGFVCGVVSCINFVIIVWKRPYEKRLNNIRAACNEATITLIFCAYGVLRVSVDYTQHQSPVNTIIGFGVISLVIGCMVLSGVVVLKLRFKDIEAFKLWR